MFNETLSKLLNEMADLLELDEDNPFRIRAFRRASQAVESTSDDLKTLSREQLLAINGIGKGIADIIEEIRTKGSCKDLEKLKKKFPEGVLQMMHVGGVGPKRAGILYKKLSIDSIAKLSHAAQKGILQTLPGFGEKLEKNILKNVTYVETSSERILISDAYRIANEIKRFLEKSSFIQKCEVAGSARRWKETVGDLDFLCTSTNPKQAIQTFLKIPSLQRVLGSGDTKASVVLENSLQCDFRVVEESSFGAALLYFTGSKEHNVRLRELAQRKGFSLNEYGLFKLSDKEKKKPIAGKTEQEVYERLGLNWIPPELREDRGEIEAALKHRLPKLIEISDVLGDFHNHTTLSDGNNTLEEMTTAAQKQGWKWFFSGDHSPSLKIASGLPVEVLHNKMKDVKNLRSKLKNFPVFTSSEVDILADGTLDYPDLVLNELDCVVASVHTRFNQDLATMTDRLCKAVENPYTDILGHLSGRLINKRPSYEFDIEAVFQAAQKSGTAIEINGQPQRQELSDVHIKRAIEMRIPLALTTDAHSIHDLENMVLAVHIARRGWAEPQHIINTMKIDALLDWLK